MLNVVTTTDHKYEGSSWPIDPRNPPERIDAPDGGVFTPTHWVEIRAGVWRIWNEHYCVIAMEVH